MRRQLGILILLIISYWIAAYFLFGSPGRIGCTMIEHGQLHHGPGTDEIDPKNDGLIISFDDEFVTTYVTFSFNPTTAEDSRKWFRQYGKMQRLDVEFLSFGLARCEGYPLRVEKIALFKRGVQ